MSITQQTPAAQNSLYNVNTQSVFLGVDGGGSSSQAALWALPTQRQTESFDTPNETFNPSNTPVVCLDEATFGPLSLKSSSEDEVRQSARALKQFIAHAARCDVTIAGAAFGLSGLDDENDLAHMARIFAEETITIDTPQCAPFGQVAHLTDGAPVLLCSDALLPLFSCGKDEGCALIAGTGSVAYAVFSSGETIRFGGWGYRVSDEGSGQWIGCECMRAALHGAEEWVASSKKALPQITREIMNALNLALPLPPPLPPQQSEEAVSQFSHQQRLRFVQPLFDWCMSHESPKDLAVLAKTAVESTTPEAMAVCQHAADALARLTAQALTSLSCLAAEKGVQTNTNKTVALGGALFTNATFRTRFEKALYTQLTALTSIIPYAIDPQTVSLVRPEMPPTYGAAALACIALEKDTKDTLQ